MILLFFASIAQIFSNRAPGGSNMLFCNEFHLGIGLAGFLQSCPSKLVDLMKFASHVQVLLLCFISVEFQTNGTVEHAKNKKMRLKAGLRGSQVLCTYFCLPGHGQCENVLNLSRFSHDLNGRKCTDAPVKVKMSMKI